MPTMDPFEGARANADEQKKGLLDAIATGGAAGRQEYENAQAQAQKQRQGALDWASQKAQITGSNYGPTTTAPVTEAADRFGTYFAGQNAAFQNNLQNIGSSAESYLAKIGAIQPFVQAQNAQQASDRENQLKMNIAANQSKIDAAKAAAAQDFQDKLKLMAIQHGYDKEDANASAALKAASAKADATDKITLPQLVGSATQIPSIFNDRLNILGQTKEGVKAGITGANLLDQANTLGQQAGVSPNKLAGLQEPGFRAGVNSDLLKLNGTATPQLPLPMSKDWIMQNVTMPGTKNKATASRADDVLRAPEIQEATNFLNDLLTVPKRDGRITDKNFGEDFVGMTAKDAFNAYIDSLPGIKTMKEALKQYYGPYLDGIR